MNLLVDSHAHLDFDRFHRDRSEVIQRAREAGLAAILNVGADLASSRAAVSLAENHDFVYAAVGVHPHSAKTVTPAVLDELRALAQHPKVVAVGEVGLDYYRDLSPRPVQRQALAEQLALASELALPVVIHSREAYEDVLAALSGWKGQGVVHCYSGGTRWLEAVLDLGFAIGITGVVTRPKEEQLHTVAATAPLERLLLETDCPYLTPKPYKGRNEPAYVQRVAETVAQLRKESIKEIARATTENVAQLFNIL